MTQMRKCEICGRPTAEGDFSKSYKHRCKECVAEATRKDRATKNKTIKDIKDFPEVPGTILNMQPDWEQRRYEVARDIFMNLMIVEHMSPNCAAEQAAVAANAFITALRDIQPQGGEYDNN